MASQAWDQKACRDQVAWVYDDGGREEAGLRAPAGDCVTRSIAIATELEYSQVHDAFSTLTREWLPGSPATKRKLRNSHPCTGIYKEMYFQLLRDIGWEWFPYPAHLNADELPSGRLIVRCDGHLTCVIDGVIHDTHDCSKEGRRPVDGYFKMCYDPSL